MRVERLTLPPARASNFLLKVRIRLERERDVIFRTPLLARLRISLPLGFCPLRRLCVPSLLIGKVDVHSRPDTHLEHQFSLWGDGFQFFTPPRPEFDVARAHWPDVSGDRS